MKRLLKHKIRLSALALLAAGLMMVVLPALSARLAAPPSGLGLVCETGTTFNLRAADTRVIMPDGNSIYMWGYTDRTSGPAELPGPALCVTEGDTVTINLTNDLPVPTSIIFPGQANVLANGSPAQPQYNAGALASLTDMAAASGGTVSYSFIAGQPGTYLYESGTDPQLQVEMGLYGLLVVRPAGHSNWAYNDSGTEFDPQREYMLLFHEIDPYLHDAIEQGAAFDMRDYHPRYYTINGRSFPDDLAPNDVPWLPDQPYGAVVSVEPSTPGSLPALLRFANAGLLSHPFHPHGNHHRIIGHDGHQLVGPNGEDASYEKFTLLVNPGQTYDATFSWYDVEGWNELTNPVPVTGPSLQNLVFEGSWYSGSPYLGQPGEFPVGTTINNECGEYYFMWHSHAGQEMINWNEGGGGMITWLRVDPPGGCP